MFLPYMGMATILLNGPRPFVQIFNPPLTEGSTGSLKKTGPGVSDFRGEVVQRSEQTMDGQWTGSDHNYLS